MDQPNDGLTAPEKLSYIIMAAMVAAVLYCHLVPAVIAGLAVHVLTVKLSRRLPSTLGRVSKELAFLIIALTVITALSASCVGLWGFIAGSNGLGAVFATVAETIDNFKKYLPAPITASLPDSVQELREQVMAMLQENGTVISSASVTGVVVFVQILIGMVIGGLTALHEFGEQACAAPLKTALRRRVSALVATFDRVVFAQVKISLLNSTLTGLFLLAAMPLCGVQVPMAPMLVVLTFIAGLIPVLGNLVSNSAITLICLGVSPGAAAAALGFLVLVHKLEYFANARIIGGEMHAATWELLCAMLVMEAAFGVAGVVAAPVLYGWLTAELSGARPTESSI